MWDRPMLASSQINEKVGPPDVPEDEFYKVVNQYWSQRKAVQNTIVFMGKNSGVTKQNTGN